MSTPQPSSDLLEPDVFTKRLCDAISATAQGRAPPFLIARRWQPHCLLFALEDGDGAAAAKIPGDFEPFESVAGEMDRDACIHAVAVWLDCMWLQLQAKYEVGGRLGTDIKFFMLWGGIRDLLRPWIDTRESLPPEQYAKVLQAWAVAEGEFHQVLVLAHPCIAELFASDRYKDTTNPILREVVDLARVRSGKTTKH